MTIPQLISVQEMISEFDRMTNDTGYGDMGLWLFQNKTAIRNHLASAQDARNAALEEAALELDGAAQDWNRIRDPGMANNARSYAKKIRLLKLQSPASQGNGEGFGILEVALIQALFHIQHVSVSDDGIYRPLIDMKHVKMWRDDLARAKGRMVTRREAGKEGKNG